MDYKQLDFTIESITLIKELAHTGGLTIMEI